MAIRHLYRCPYCGKTKNKITRHIDMSAPCAAKRDAHLWITRIERELRKGQA